MRDVIRFIFYFLLSVTLSRCGFSIFEISFWVIGFSVAIVCAFIEFKFFPPKKNNE